MRRLVLARHAETEWNARGTLLNGDPSVDVRLSERGCAQARTLGAAAGPVDVVAHTSFGRTRETAELAWPDAPRVEVRDLDEISYGAFEGRAWADGYGDWCAAASPQEESPGGGESRVAAVTRFVRGYRALAEREEETVAFVGHGMNVAYVVLALQGLPPSPVLPSFPPAVAMVVAGERLLEAVAVLERWLGEPAWR